MSVRQPWGTVYDAEELRRQIDRLVSSGRLPEEFFQPLMGEGDRCQGDIVRLNARPVFIDSDGRPRASEDAVEHWVVVGNSCDLDRSLEDVPFTNAVPLRRYARDTFPAPMLEDLRRYRVSREFNVPPWNSEEKGVLLAKFMEIASVRREAIMAAPLVARLSLHGWLLFHGVLVRYLAREDRREMP